MTTLSETNIYSVVGVAINFNVVNFLNNYQYGGSFFCNDSYISAETTNGIQFLGGSTCTLVGTPSVAQNAVYLIYAVGYVIFEGENLDATLILPCRLNFLDIEYPASVYYRDTFIVIPPSYPTISPGVFTPINFSISPILPDGMSINSETGIISGTPTTIEPEAVLYTVTFNDLATDSYTYPQSTGTYSRTFTMWGTYVYYDQIEAFPGPSFGVAPIITGATPNSFEFGSSVPDSFEIDPDTGNITGSPTNADAGIYNITVNFLVGSVQHSTIFTITITAVECLTGDANILIKMGKKHGYKRIDSLHENDFIVTNKNKTTKIKNIHVISNYIGELYCIPKQSLTPVYPTNDIYATPNHGYFINNRWYKPHKGKSNKKIQQTNPINLYHIELDDHEDNIVVNGLTMESHNGKSL